MMETALPVPAKQVAVACTDHSSQLRASHRCEGRVTGVGVCTLCDGMPAALYDTRASKGGLCDTSKLASAVIIQRSPARLVDQPGVGAALALTKIDDAACQRNSARPTLISQS